MNITTSLTTSEEIIAKSRAVDGDDGDGVGVGGRVLTCVGCRSTITDQYILQVSPDLEWHVDCLRCNECHQPLDEQNTCFVRNGKTYCKADYLRLFGIKCVGCRLGFKMSDLVMRTRHRIFHLECFRCSVCRRRLIPGDEYALDDDHDPVALYCRHDYDAIVISPRSPSSVGLPPPLTPQDTFLLIRGADGNDDETKAATTNDDVTSDNNNDLKTTTNENHLSSSPHNNTSTTSNSSSSNSSTSGPGGGGGGGGATGMAMLKSTAAAGMVGKRGGGGGGGTGGSRSSGGGSAGGGGGRSLHAKSTDHHPKTTRVRTVLNEKQLHTLRTCYAANPRPDALMKDQLVEMTGLSSRVIRVWFQNKRCKDKKRTILIKQIQQQQQQHNDKLHGGGIPLIATSPVQHDPSSSSSSSALIQVNPVEIHRFIHHHHSTSSSWNSISSSVAASSLAAAAAATEGGGGVTGGPSYDPLNQPPLQISTFDARDPGQDQASSQGQGHVMASFQQLLSSFGESDDDDTVVSLEETSAAAAAGLQGPLTPGLHPPPPPISIGRGTQPPASATASVALQASRVAMQRIARFSKDLHLRHPSRLSIHHHHHPHHHHQHQQQHHQSPPSLPPHLFNNASITNNSSSSSNFISTATHLIQQSGMKAFDTKC